MAENHPSQKMPRQKRARLFAAGTAEFAAHGFSQASLNRIIADVAMSKSSFYHYFENKTDLFVQILDHAFAPFIAAGETFDFDTLDVETYWPTITTMMRNLTLIAGQSPELVMVGRMFYRSRESPADQALTRVYMDMVTAWLGDLVRRGQALGLLRTDLPESLVMEVVMALGISIDQWFLQHWEALDDATRLSLSDKSTDLLLRLLRR